MSMIENPTEDSILAGLLETASNQWLVDGEPTLISDIIENMNKIAYHESAGTMDPTIHQYEGGPGRGLYQFEIDRPGQYDAQGNEYINQGAATAAQRLVNQLGYEPEFLQGFAESGYDASKLTPEQQQILFLGNILQMPNKPNGEDRVLANFAGVDTDEELADYWAQYHHAGTELGSDEYNAMIQKFLGDMPDYKAPEYQEGGQVPTMPQETLWDNIPILDYLNNPEYYTQLESPDEYSDLTHGLNRRELEQDIRSKHKYDYFGKDYYHRAFDEDIEAKINSGEINREEAEWNRFNVDLNNRSNPDNLSEKEHMYQWAGYGDEYREILKLKKTDRKLYREKLKELENEALKEETVLQGDRRGSSYGITIEDAYYMFKDKYSSIDDLYGSDDDILD